MSKPSKKPPSHFHPSPAALPQETPSHVRIQHLAAELLAPPPPKSSIPQTGATTTDATYPHVPGEEDLIGFVTTGNFDLGQGRARAIGCVALARIEEIIGSGRGDGKDLGHNMIGANESQTRAKKDDTTTATRAKLCIVRNAGQSMGKLARWEFI
jgi:ribonuclease P/MRP protein subunit POP1